MVHIVVSNPAEKTWKKPPVASEYTTRGAAAMAAKGQPTRTPKAATATVALGLFPKSTSADARVIAYMEKVLGKKPGMSTMQVKIFIPRFLNLLHIGPRANWDAKYSCKYSTNKCNARENILWLCSRKCRIKQFEILQGKFNRCKPEAL